jgi:tetratricopeptide (TPR) repeat protein
MKRYVRYLLIFTFISFGLSCLSLAGSPWYLFYEKGLQAQDKKDWSASIDYLRQALAVKEYPKLKAKTYGLRFVNYLPYFYLGVAYYHLGNKQEAIENFELSENYGQIKNSRNEYVFLRRLKAELTGEKYEPLPEEVEKTIVNNRERAANTEKIPGISEDLNANLPWYVSYESGLEYINSGDWLKAIENLKSALSVKSRPKQYARTYGMWFISYLPYYYLGMAYYNQGLWQNALKYLETSDRFGQVKFVNVEYSNLQTLLAAAKNKLTKEEGTPISNEVEQTINNEILEGVRLFNEMKFSKAAIKFKAILQLDPYNSVAMSYLKKIKAQAPSVKSSGAPQNDFMAGIHALFQGNYDDAIVLLNSAKAKIKKDANLHAYLGAAYSVKYFSTGKTEQVSHENAVAEFTKAVEIDSQYELDSRVFSDEVIELFNRVKKEGKR